MKASSRRATSRRASREAPQDPRLSLLPLALGTAKPGASPEEIRDLQEVAVRAVNGFLEHASREASNRAACGKVSDWTVQADTTFGMHIQSIQAWRRLFDRAMARADERAKAGDAKAERRAR